MLKNSTGSVYLYDKHKIVMVSVVWEQIASAHGAPTAKNGVPLGVLLLLSVFLMFKVLLFSHRISSVVC